MQKTGLFEERPGVTSSTRVLSFWLMAFFMAYNGYALYMGLATDLAFNFMLLVAIFAPKYLHKVTEVKDVVGKGTIVPPSAPTSTNNTVTLSESEGRPTNNP